MFWLDWIIVVIPMLLVVYIGLKCQKYVNGVAGFLAANRVAGRYVIAVAGGEVAAGLVSFVAAMEQEYHCGFAVSFWNRITIPITVIFALTGYCHYRFRETKALTMGQFLEMRYNRSFRVTAAVLQFVSGVLNFAIFPAIGARFLIYYLGLPLHFQILGITVSTYMLVVFFCISLALSVVLIGGQVTIMVTDCVLGLLSYPMYLIVVAYFIYRFSWSNELVPALNNRVPGESFINPYDIFNLRDFNIILVLASVAGSIINRMSWSGSLGYSAAARNAHEQKMSGLLGTWRSGFRVMMYTLMAVAALTFLNHPDFASSARKLRLQLSQMVMSDVVGGSQFTEARQKITQKLEALPDQIRRPGIDKPLSSKDNPDAVYCNTVKAELKDVPGGAKAAQGFRTIFGQMLVPVALREMLPIGLTGIVCCLMIFMMVSTDDTYMHSWGTVLAQDFILPLRKKAFTPKQQLFVIRICMIAVALIAFVFSIFFAQLDYIIMFMKISGLIWLGGSGPTIVFGLYSRFGSTLGAFASLISGAVIGVGGFLMQYTWPSHVYPWLESHRLVEPVGKFLTTVSAPMNPWVVWEMNPHKFPINSYELTLIAMIVSIALYIICSLLSRSEAFNLDRMLHRGAYNEEGKVIPKIPFAPKTILKKMLGINAEYTKGDKVLAWALFIYNIIYTFGLTFLAVVIWNAITPWPIEWWSMYFFVTHLLVTGIIAVVSTVWFTIGGYRDLRQLFVDLGKVKTDDSDDGRVQ